MSGNGTAGRWVLGAAGLLLLGAATPARSHHSYAVFDRSRSVTLKGTVKAFAWANPHVGIVLTVQDHGRATDYAIEAQSPNALDRMGWKADTLKPGDRLTVRINPYRDGGAGGSFIEATTAKGRKLEAYY